jgi:hypothetical protein
LEAKLPIPNFVLRSITFRWLNPKNPAGSTSEGKWQLITAK